MKKLAMIVALAAAAVSAKAASVQWNVAGVAGDVGSTVYLLTSIADSYATIDEFTNSAVADKAIASAGRGKYGTGDVTSADPSITTTANYYLAVVDADSKGFTYVDVTSMAQAKVFDPQAQESAKGSFSTSFSSITGGTHMNIGQAVPEPTSGLLFLVGMAGLALRRKQK